MTDDARQRGEAIRARRRELQMTQKQLARAADVSEGTIRNLESGAYKRPQAGVLASVSDALGVDVEAIGGNRAEVVRNTMFTSEVRVALDVLGGWLMAMPEHRREAALSTLYKWMLGGPGPLKSTEQHDSVK